MVTNRDGALKVTTKRDLNGGCLGGLLQGLYLALDPLGQGELSRLRSFPA